MTARNTWLVLGGPVGLLLVGFLVFRGGSTPPATADQPREAGPVGGLPQQPSAARPVGGATPPAPPAAVPAVIGANDPVAVAGGAMAYRPAELLRYSEDSPEEDPASDEPSKVLARIFEVTRADAAQQQQIRALWRIHEDGRRILFAAARPRVSGPRILDFEKVQELDSAFETALFGEVLRPGQRARLAQELPPAGSPPPPPKVFPPPAK